MKITDFFDKTFCINLERRSDRWEECVVEFNKYNLSNINRFIAVDGKQLPQVTSGFVTPSRLALVLTNIKILGLKTHLITMPKYLNIFGHCSMYLFHCKNYLLDYIRYD